MAKLEGRVRRVTLTEIEDEKEWDLPNPGNIEEDSFDEEDEESEESEDEEEMDTEELFNQYDILVQDWKRKVEVIIGEGLKQVRKNGRDKRMQVKFIPGESTNTRKELYTKARASIATDLQEEMVMALTSTQRKLNKLTVAKQQETVELVSKVAKPHQLVINKVERKKKQSKEIDLKALLKDMDSLYGSYAEKNVSKIPVYNLNVEKTRSSMFGWWKPICTLFNMLDYPAKKAITFDNTESNILNILKDFTVEQKTRKSLVEEWDKHSTKKTVATKLKKTLKTGRRGVSNPAQRMLERRERRKFALREFEDKGEKHFLVVRRQLFEDEGDAEDITEDCKTKVQVKKPRKKKITNRAQRKEILKEAFATPVIGPCTYAQVLRKNLKRTEPPAVEDVFSSFAEYIESMSNPPLKPEDKGNDMVYIFHSWRHNLSVPKQRMEDIDILESTTCLPSLASFTCGQPTVISTPKTSRKSNQKQVTTKKAAQLVKSFKAPKPVAVDLKQNNIEPKLQELIKQTHQETSKETLSTTPIKAPKQNEEITASTKMVTLQENDQLKKEITKDITKITKKGPAEENVLPTTKASKKELPKEFVPSAHSKRKAVPEPILDFLNILPEPVQAKKSTPSYLVKINTSPVEVKEPLAPVEVKKPVAPVEVRKPVAPVEVKKPVAPVEVKKPVAPVEVKKPVAPVEVKEPLAPVEVKKPVAPVEVKKSVAPVEVKNPIAHVEVEKLVAPVSIKKSPKALRKVKLDFTCESFFNDWIYNLETPEIKITASTPKIERKSKVEEKIVEEEMFEDDKDSRRRDFAKVTKIKDKKRAQASRNSTGKRIK